jgi:hypothetical protein
VDSCLLDFNQPCCAARYIARLRRADLRRGWLERLRARKEVEFMQQVEARLLEIWAAGGWHD